MGLTLLEAAKYEKRVERLAVLKTFSEGEPLRTSGKVIRGQRIGK